MRGTYRAWATRPGAYPARPAPAHTCPVCCPDAARLYLREALALLWACIVAAAVIGVWVALLRALGAP